MGVSPDTMGAPFGDFTCLYWVTPDKNYVMCKVIPKHETTRIRTASCPMMHYAHHKAVGDENGASQWYLTTGNGPECNDR